MPNRQTELLENTCIQNSECNANAEIACMDNLEFMRGLSDESMNLVVTSPPYNIGKSYEKPISQEEYVENQSACIGESVRLLAPDGSICWQVGHHVDKGTILPLDILLYPLFKAHGLFLQNRIVWTFGHGLHCRKRFSGRHETILWFTKSGDYTFNPDAAQLPLTGQLPLTITEQNEYSDNIPGHDFSDVWDIPNVKSNHVEKTAHPCQFPVGLVERLVLTLTNSGDNVLDPYLGAGSSAIASLKHGRHAYGCDLDREYIEIARDRIRQLREGTLRTRPMNKPVHVPEPGF